MLVSCVLRMSMNIHRITNVKSSKCMAGEKIACFIRIYLNEIKLRKLQELQTESCIAY